MLRSRLSIVLALGLVTRASSTYIIPRMANEVVVSEPTPSRDVKTQEA